MKFKCFKFLFSIKQGFQVERGKERGHERVTIMTLMKTGQWV